jgi:hypothetical protein
MAIKIGGSTYLNPLCSDKKNLYRHTFSISETSPNILTWLIRDNVCYSSKSKRDFAIYTVNLSTGKIVSWNEYNTIKYCSKLMSSAGDLVLQGNVEFMVPTKKSKRTLLVNQLQRLRGNIRTRNNMGAPPVD